MLYLYGIVPHHAELPTLETPGMEGTVVQFMALPPFTVIYSEVSGERFLASRRNLLCHETVLETLMQQGYPTLLPLQFGVMVNDWAQVHTELLQPRQAKLTALLSSLAGYREVGVKIFWDENTELQLLLAANSGLAAMRDRLEGRQLGMDEVIAFGQRVEKGLQARQYEITTTFQADLNPLAREVVENPPLTDAMIYNAAYLIAWDSEPEFAAAVEALDHRFSQRLRIRYNNFTAPYNFTKLED